MTMPGSPSGSALDAAVEGALGRLGTRSAVALLQDGPEAFAARAAAARMAARTLDLQYYAWHGDAAGRLMAAEVLRAAERGVAVRLLLDDAFALGAERLLLALARHPGIEIRLFNGPRWRMLGPLGFGLEMLLGGWHLNRRMHNKAWIADGRIAILGGRNIGDAYFGAATSANFHDLDVVVAGDAAAGAVLVFERFWRSRLARPAAQASAVPEDRDALAALHAEMAAAAGMAPALEAMLEGAQATAQRIGRGLLGVEEGAARIVADPPRKAERGPSRWRLRRTRGGIAPEIVAALQAARREALLISPYFVPGRRGCALLEALVRRGVRVSVITNSLAATDVPAAHGGYARYRRRLLRRGVELHELRHLGPGQQEKVAGLFGSRGVSLHSKALVVDGQRGFVGSFNLDPRSATLNTEMGVSVRHAGFAAALRAEHARLASPALSWRVELRPGRLAWMAGRREEGAERHEPGASLPRRLAAFLARLLPVESQL